MGHGPMMMGNPSMISAVKQFQKSILNQHGVENEILKLVFLVWSGNLTILLDETDSVPMEWWQ